MTLVREDDKGLFVRAGGYVARPGHVSGYSHAYRMDAAGLVAGDHVKARHRAGTPLVKLVQQDGLVVHWCTSEMLVTSPPICLLPYDQVQEVRSRPKREVRSRPKRRPRLAHEVKRRVKERYLRIWDLVKVKGMTKAAAAREVGVSTQTVTVALYRVGRMGINGPENFAARMDREIEKAKKNIPPVVPLPGLPRRARGEAWTPEQVYVETMRERE